MIEMSSRPPLMMPSASLRFDARADGVGVGLVPLEEPVLEGAQLEEVVLLLEQLDRRAVDGAVAVDELGLLLVVLAGHAVQPAVDPELGVAVVVDLLQELLHGPVVAGLGGADEVVVGDVEPVPGLDEARRRAVHPLLRGHAVGLGGPGDLVPVLVGPGEEEDVVAQQPVPPGQGVGDRPSCRRARCGARRSRSRSASSRRSGAPP